MSTRRNPYALAVTDHADQPPAASSRGYLRGGLPAIYQDSDFSMRFVGALEVLLDPIVGVLDNLPSHFDAWLTSEELLELLAGWLGMELDEAWAEEQKREMVSRASDLARRRGTRQGLEDALSIAFPDLPLRVEDGGGVVWATKAEELSEATEPQFVIYCDKPTEEPAMLARMIEVMKPVHVDHKLRIKSPRKKKSS
jgi:phage tail-like protein